MEKYIDDVFINLSNGIGIDLLYGITLIDILLFIIIFGKNLSSYLRKDTRGYEKLFKGYVKSQIFGIMVLIVLCILHFLNLF